MTPISVYVIVATGVLGLLIGSFLNVVAYRVPAHISLMRESRCPQCDARIKPLQNLPVVSWIALRGKCANCAASIAVRYPIIEAVAGIVFAGVTWWAIVVYGPSTGSGSAAMTMESELWGSAVLVVALLYLAAISIVLTLIDLDTHRLPNSIVLPSYVVGGVLLSVASWLMGDWGALLRAVIGMALLYAFYFALRLVRPGAMGGGDVKLAGVLGLYLGWIGWGALAVGAFAAFVVGGVWGIALILARKAGRKTAIPFGPWMIIGAWVGVVAGNAIGRWYVNLLMGT